jgi:hypothetical protein
MLTDRWTKSTRCDSSQCVEVQWKTACSSLTECVEVGRQEVARPDDEEETRDDT